MEKGDDRFGRCKVLRLAGSPGPKPWERSELLGGEFPLSTRTKNPHADLDTRLGKHVGI